MAERGNGPRREPPDTAGEALGRAREHARCAVAEGLAAVQALLDAGALATSGGPAGDHAALRPLQAVLQDLTDWLGGADGASLPAALADALDAEIDRWEKRARDDADARAVLRVYLGVREILWELGLRPADRGAEPRRKPRRRREPPPDASPRVQRVTVEG